MISYDEGYERLERLLAAATGSTPEDNGSKYWHRFEHLPNGVVVNVETKERTPRHLKIYVSYDQAMGVGPPAWGKFRENGEGHTARASRRLSRGPHHLFDVRTLAQLDEVLAYVRSLLARSGGNESAQQTQQLQSTATRPELRNFEDDYAAAEGAVYLALHRKYERDAELVRQKKTASSAESVGELGLR